MADPDSRWLPFLPVGQILMISTVLTAVSLAVAATNPDRNARSELAGWLDVLGENTLPSWWSTALLLAVALTFAVAGAAARAGAVVGAGAWFTGAGIVGVFSLAELSGMHRRLGGVGRVVLGEGVLTRNWFTMAAVVVPVLVAVLVALAARVGTPSSRLLVGGGVLLLMSAVGGELVAALLGGRTGPVLVAHLGAAVLAVLSLDDQSQLHERSEQLGRLMVTETGGFPFYWLIPGTLAGLGVAAAIVMLAVRVHRRARALLICGIVLMLATGLGLEVVQGMFMAAENEGIGFVVGYHLEELGEDVGVILLIGAAAAMTRISRNDGLVLRYVGAAAHPSQPDRHPVRTSAGP
jgi:hypothetical protein